MADIKDNRIHAVLRVLSSGLKYDYELDELAKAISTRFTKYDIHDTGYACSVLEKRKLEFTKYRGRHTTLRVKEGITLIRQTYKSRRFKEPSSFWTLTNSILTALASIATVCGVSFGILAYSRQNTIEKQEGELKSKDKQIEKLTNAKDSLTDRIETAGKRIQELATEYDSLRQVKK